MNNSFSDITSGIIVSDVSDHFPIYALMSDLNTRNKPHSYNASFRNMSETNLNKLREKLRSVNWSAVYNQREVNSSFENSCIF